MRRFEHIHQVVEPVEEYRAGGYHPVHLEDAFKQRYRIVGEMGIWPVFHSLAYRRHKAEFPIYCL